MIDGGDKAMGCEFNGVSSGSTHPCQFCECSEGELLTMDLEALKNVHRPLRTIERIKQLAHLVPGDCPAPNCGMHITEPAKPGDPVPKNKNGRSYPANHFGVMHGRAPLARGPRRFVLCVLHMVINIMGSMFNDLIWSRLDETELNAAIAAASAPADPPAKKKPKKSKKSKGAVSAADLQQLKATRVEKLFALLKGAGINPSWSIGSAGTAASKSATPKFHKASLPGKESALMEKGDLWEKMCDLMFDGAGTSTFEEQKRRVLKAMETWRPFYRELTSEWEEEDWCVEGRKKKAQTARKLARKKAQREGLL